MFLSFVFSFVFGADFVLCSFSTWIVRVNLFFAVSAFCLYRRPPQVMEMYADVESRGGILEPPGICEVKFRAADQVSKMHEVIALPMIPAVMYTVYPPPPIVVSALLSSSCCAMR